MKLLLSALLFYTLLFVAYGDALDKTKGKTDEHVIHYAIPEETMCMRACPSIYSPVCGSDSVTYANSCELEAGGCRKGVVLSIDYWGECKRI